jgi:hypothetical protein
MVYGLQNWGTVRVRNSKEASYGNEWGFNVQQPDDSGRYLGHYSQRNDADQMNYRIFGNMNHTVATASSSRFMQTLDTR